MKASTGELRHSWRLWIAIVGSMLGLLACNQVTTTPLAYSTQPTPGITTDGLQPTVDSLAVDDYAAGIEARQTLVAIEARQTAEAEAHQRRVWEITVTAEAQYAAATATAEIRHVSATATAWIMTVEAERAQATSTAVAQQTAIAFEREQMQAQATREALATAEARAREERILALTLEAARSEQEAINALNAEVLERERLVTERERLIYPVRAYGPWVLLSLAACLLAYACILFVRAGETRLRALSRDARGDAPVLVMHQGKQVQVIDVDTSLYGVVEIDRHGGVHQPQLADPERQERVKMRDQFVDLKSRGLPSAPSNRARQRIPAQGSRMFQGSPPRSAGPVQVIDPRQVQSWLRDVERQALTGTFVEGEILEG